MHPIKTSLIAGILMSTMAPLCSYGQDSVVTVSSRLQQEYASTVNSKVSGFNRRVESTTRKNLDELVAQEKKMQQMVGRLDSLKAKSLFHYSIDSLRRFQNMISGKTSKLTHLFKGSYFAYLDTLKGSLSFFKRADSVAGQASRLQSKLHSSLGAVDQMESRLSTVNQISIYLQKRQQVLEDQLKVFPMLANSVRRFGGQAAAYQARVNTYKGMLADPDRIEKVVVSKLEHSTSFQHFFQQNSQLSGTFASLPNLAAGGLGTMPIVNGIPSRGALKDFTNKEMPGLANIDPVERVQQKIPSNGGAAMDAGGLPSLSSLGIKIPQSGQFGNGGTPPQPSNHQSGLTFARRLEYGFTTQFAGRTNYLPASANLGLQVGYKLNDKSSIGVGATYSLGLGTGWSHIRFSNNSLGLRQYLTYKTGKSFFLQGGTEFTYMTGFIGMQQLRNLSAWQTSALLGAGREYRIGKKMKGNILLLYDFLYSQHHPPSQPLVFRFGYNL